MDSEVVKYIYKIVKIQRIMFINQDDRSIEMRVTLGKIFHDGHKRMNLSHHKIGDHEDTHEINVEIQSTHSLTHE